MHANSEVKTTLDSSHFSEDERWLLLELRRNVSVCFVLNDRKLFTGFWLKLVTCNLSYPVHAYVVNVTYSYDKHGSDFSYSLNNKTFSPVPDKGRNFSDFPDT